MDNKEAAIQEITKLLHELMIADTVGLEFKDAGEITINGYKSQGYSKAGTFEGVKDVHLKNQNHIAPLQTDTVQNLIARAQIDESHSKHFVFRRSCELSSKNLGDSN